MEDKTGIERAIKLSLIGRSEESLKGIRNEIPKILEYVEKVKKIADDKFDNLKTINVMREDVVTCEKGKYTKAILDNAYDSKGNYIKVKKV